MFYVEKNISSGAVRVVSFAAFLAAERINWRFYFQPTSWSFGPFDAHEAHEAAAALAAPRAIVQRGEYYYVRREFAAAYVRARALVESDSEYGEKLLDIVDDIEAAPRWDAATAKRMVARVGRLCSATAQGMYAVPSKSYSQLELDMISRICIPDERTEIFVDGSGFLIPETPVRVRKGKANRCGRDLRGMSAREKRVAKRLSTRTTRRMPLEWTP